MKIAMIGQKGIPAIQGGVERHVHDLSVRLVTRGYDVTVYARKWYTGKITKMVDGVTVINTPSINTKHFDSISHTFTSTIHAIRHGVDVIHYHGVGPSLLSWIPRLFAPRIIVITTFHSIDRKHQKWNWFAQKVLRLGEWTACNFAHHTLAVSQTIQQYARDVYDCEAEYIPNAVTLKKPTKRIGALSNWNVKPGGYVLMVSRLIPHKGAHYLTAAWEHLRQTSPSSVRGKKLVIVGDGYYTDAYVSRLKHDARNDDSIIFTGFQSGDTLDQLYAHAAFLIHPSNNEGMPVVVLEAMAHGRPVLASNIPEHRDLVTNPIYLFAPGSVSDLARALKGIFKCSREQRETEGKHNRNTIAAEYTWDHVAEKVIAVYEQECSEEQKSAIIA